MTRPYGLHPAQAQEPAPSDPPALAETAADTPTSPVVDDDGTWPLHESGGPCRTWPVAPGCSALPEDPAAWDDDHRNAVATATGLLWAATAGVFGLCRDTVRPCSPQQPLPPFRYPPARPRPPVIPRAYADPATCEAWCGCNCEGGLQLPGPVYAPPLDTRFAPQVWLDGELFTEWKLLSGDRLLRTDDHGWPRWQDLRRPLRPPDGGELADSAATFGVVYWRGLPVPAGGRRSVAMLADEILKACAGDEACKLPSRLIARIERQGVTYQLVDPRDFLDQGRFGITEIDVWVASVNPHQLKARPQVYSPDAIEWHTEPTSSAYPGGVP